MKRAILLFLATIYWTGSLHAQTCFVYTGQLDGCSVQYPLPPQDHDCFSQCLINPIVGPICDQLHQESKTYQRSTYDFVFPGVTTANIGYNLSTAVSVVCYTRKNCHCTDTINGMMCVKNTDSNPPPIHVLQRFINLNSICTPSSGGGGGGGGGTGGGGGGGGGGGTEGGGGP